jgi:acetyl-CoA carboxylase biotin carboxylase subunit
MGDKSNAKKTMKRIGVPTVPGSDGPVENLEMAKVVARQIGYPLLIKASAGGGGKGMREVTSELQFDGRYEAAKAEAGASFSNDEVYLERLIRRPRHIEVQVLADSYGNAIHLCERDCSIQRRRQKVIEEAPSPALDEILRQNMAKMALRAVREIGYLGAGTIEFLLDEDGSFYFMEMNTRIQVEHPVSEAITGIDIVKEQINIASGLKLSTLDKSPTRPNGHAIEFRINAEDSEAGFMPNPGKITKLVLPGGPGVRVDTHIYEGYSVPPNYDSLIAKIIIWGRDRTEAIARAKRALRETKIEGIKTTIPFHLKVLENPTFVCGNYYTDFIEREMGIQ